MVLLANNYHRMKNASVKFHTLWSPVCSYAAVMYHVDVNTGVLAVPDYSTYVVLHYHLSCVLAIHPIVWDTYISVSAHFLSVEMKISWSIIVSRSNGCLANLIIIIETVLFFLSHFMQFQNWCCVIFCFQINKEMLSQASTKFAGVVPHTKEAYYYRQAFEEMFPNCSHLIPYYWLPKWSSTNDPSARTLNHYVQ